VWDGKVWVLSHPQLKWNLNWKGLPWKWCWNGLKPWFPCVSGSNGSSPLSYLSRFSAKNTYLHISMHETNVYGISHYKKVKWELIIQLLTPWYAASITLSYTENWLLKTMNEENEAEELHATLGSTEVRKRTNVVIPRYLTHIKCHYNKLQVTLISFLIYHTCSIEKIL
jgi:hypothetical protein